MFGARWDPERYGRALTACALEHDLAGFSAGDQTELGERGLNLSGGLSPTLPHPAIPYPPPSSYYNCYQCLLAARPSLICWSPMSVVSR